MTQEGRIVVEGSAGVFLARLDRADRDPAQALHDGRVGGSYGE